MSIDRRAVSRLLAAFLAFPKAGAARAEEPTSGRRYWPTVAWESAPPEAQGMDAGLLAWADERFRAETPLLSSVVVVRGGDIVFEGNYAGLPLEKRAHIWSVTKSVTNIAVGIALAEGVLSSVEQTLGELIPERIPGDADPRVWGITVHHLLTMTAGWAWDSRINFARAPETDDLDLMLGRPMQCDPGYCFEYDSGCSNLLSYLVQARSGGLMADYLQPRLFDPLGIATPYWITTVDGATRGGGGLYLSPREMAKIGFLYLSGGQWDGQQLVSPEWVDLSTREHASGFATLSGVNIGPGPYGYHWWLAAPAGVPAFVASGYGGQLIYVVPGLDLVVATLYSRADATRPDLQQSPHAIIAEAIVPAAFADNANA